MKSHQFGTTVTVHYLHGTITGPRVVDCRTTPLRILACPWGEFADLLPVLPASAGVYMLSKPSAQGVARLSVRPGEAQDLRRRLTEHYADPSKSSFKEIYAVSSLDNRLSKSDVRYMEARFHELLAANGSVLEVERIPAVSALAIHDRDVLETLIDHSRLMLSAAGCLSIDTPQLTQLQREQEIELIEVEANASLISEDEHELTYDGVWSRGYPTADGGFLVRAGSDIRRRENGALLPNISQRRKTLAAMGVLGTLPGVADRWRLLANLRCSSMLTAAKIVTGAHVTNRGVWQRIAPDNRTVVAK